MRVKKLIWKFTFRFLITCVIYFFIKLSVQFDEGDDMLTRILPFYFTTAFAFFLITWEVNDWLILKNLNQKKIGGFTFYDGVRIIFLTLLFVVPFYILVYYLGVYEFPEWCKIDVENKAVILRRDVLRATFIGMSFSGFNTYYHSNKSRNEMAFKIRELEKEVAISKYESLKDQISPHFLFNSLNTLTSLMYEDRDLASDFVTRLAKCYRYIIDNREKNMVSLESELQFLDAFIFMMDVRHKGALQINKHIEINIKDFKIPTLSLQMLVENALKHNYFSKHKPMLIEILVDKTKSLVVRNTLNKRVLEEPTTKMGLSNIIKRYELVTDEKVEITSKEGVFEIKLPLLKEATILQHETLRKTEMSI